MAIKVLPLASRERVTVVKERFHSLSVPSEATL